MTVGHSSKFKCQIYANFHVRVHTRTYNGLPEETGIFSPKLKPGKPKYGPSNGLVTRIIFKPIPLSMAEAKLQTVAFQHSPGLFILAII